MGTIISHNPICLFTITKKTLYIIEYQYCSFSKELVIYSEFILEYIYYLMVIITCRRHPIGGGNSLRLLFQRPSPPKFVASVQIGGGGISHNLEIKECLNSKTVFFWGIKLEGGVFLPFD
jgi:hypothetical protein